MNIRRPEPGVSTEALNHHIKHYEPPIMCGCEHENHLSGEDHKTPKPGYHKFRAVPAGKRRALFVGEVCDACAKDCMKNYMVEDLDKFEV